MALQSGTFQGLLRNFSIPAFAHLCVDVGTVTPAQGRSSRISAKKVLRDGCQVGMEQQRGTCVGRVWGSYLEASWVEAVRLHLDALFQGGVWL